MRHALTVALQGFEGALVVVSHDRHLLSNTVDEFYSIHNGSCQEFEGDLHDYEKWMQDNSKSSTGTSVSAPDEKKGDRKEQRQQAAAQRQQLAPLRNEIKKLEQQMDKAHKLLAEVEELLADATLYDEGRKAQLAELLSKQATLKANSDSLEEQWLEKSEAFEELGQ